MAATLDLEAPLRGRMAIRLEGVTSTGNGGIGAVANPEGVDVAILRSQLYIVTPSTGAANLSCGVGATASTSTDDIIDALAVNGSIAGKIYNGSTIQVTSKTEITAPAVWAADKYLTFTGSASTAGLEAYLFVEYVRLA